MTIGTPVPTLAADELHARARKLLGDGDPASARSLMERVVAMEPRHVPYWLSLAAVLRVLGLYREELSVLERALVVDPTHLVVLLQKGAVLDLMNMPRSAAAVYTHALQTLPAGARLPAPLQAHVAQARQRIGANSAKLAALIEGRLAGLPAASSAERMRFDRCLAQVLGKTKIFMPEPTFMLFPYLVNYEFFPRSYFPWLDALEAETSAIRDELAGVLSADDAGIEPYIAYHEGLPLKQWAELNHSRRWGAYFLWNQGRPEEGHLARCPRTAAALSRVPQVDVPGRGPTAFFSLLDARTAIPAHTGVTNTRLTVHLPLIVPDGCRFRVGGDTREWRVGSAWVFDDTIEHEAWNDADVSRALLIFDIWNPQLSPLERDLLREATAAIAEYNDAEVAAAGVQK